MWGLASGNLLPTQQQQQQQQPRAAHRTARKQSLSRVHVARNSTVDDAFGSSRSIMSILKQCQFQTDKLTQFAAVLKPNIVKICSVAYG
jgi:hypothetical protein